jgi:hypothetical protein
MTSPFIIRDRRAAVCEMMMERSCATGMHVPKKKKVLSDYQGLRSLLRCHQLEKSTVAS